MLSFFSVMASSGSRQANITIQIGHYTVTPPKVPTSNLRGSVDLLPSFGTVQTPGDHSPKDNVLGERLYNIYIFLNIDGSYSFQLLLDGDTSSSVPSIRITPENYGGSLTADAEFPYQTSTTTGYVFDLPNANLFNNWAVGSTRTCLLEKA